MHVLDLHIPRLIFLPYLPCPNHATHLRTLAHQARQRLRRQHPLLRRLLLPPPSPRRDPRAATASPVLTRTTAITVAWTSARRAEALAVATSAPLAASATFRKRAGYAAKREKHPALSTVVRQKTMKRGSAQTFLVQRSRSDGVLENSCAYSRYLAFNADSSSHCVRVDLSLYLFWVNMKWLILL